MPSSTSAQNLLHFSQMFATNRFQKYDYGLLRNLKIYNSLTPPKYSLQNITYPNVHVIYGQNDWFVPIQPNGVELLKQELQGAKFYQISDPKSNHMDPLIGLDIAQEVTQKVVDIIVNSE